MGPPLMHICQVLRKAGRAQEGVVCTGPEFEFHSSPDRFSTEQSPCEYQANWSEHWRKPE